MKNTVYFKQAQLILRILSLFAANNDFALKGGTAINFFVRNMPRLSVDIDLTYIPITDRNTALKKITSFLNHLCEKINKHFHNATLTRKSINESKFINRIIVKHNDATIKIEPNLVIRGTVFPAERRELCKKAQDTFELNLDALTLSIPDLYGGKICAALDRQHPRDLFDVKLLLDNEGFNDEIRKAFIVYLISHHRPIIELLNPGIIDIKDIYDKEFKDMTVYHINYDDIIATRNTIINTIKYSLTDNEKKFLLSVKSVNPEWDLLDLKDIHLLPAVKWKLINIRKMKKSKRDLAYRKLYDFFY